MRLSGGAVSIFSSSDGLGPDRAWKDLAFHCTLSCAESSNLSTPGNQSRVSAVLSPCSIARKRSRHSTPNGLSRVWVRLQRERRLNQQARTKGYLLRARQYSTIYKAARSARTRGPKRDAQDDLTETIERVSGLLAELQKDFAAATRPDARQLEVSLTGLERMLSDALLRVASPEELAAAQKEVKEQLRPYRSQMEKAAYEQTFNNLLLKRLREISVCPG